MSRSRRLRVDSADIEAGLLKALSIVLDRASPQLEFAAHAQNGIPASMTFRQWCEGLAAEQVDPETGERRPGLKVDGKPFRLDDRPAMAWIYDQVPSTPAEAFRFTLVLRKCAQVGFTVMEMLVTIYFALKFEPLKIGMFVPTMSLARAKSAERFMPIVRTVPMAYSKLIGGQASGSAARASEGNVELRRMGESLFHFRWTSGKTSTESHPMDVITFDEVQEMKIADMEKARERLSASTFKCTLMGSTANWPDADIDYWYKKGSQHRFHTVCPDCGVAEPLDDNFPDCIKFDPDFPDRVSGAPGDYRYVCRAGHWIDDPQVGDWRPDNPEAIGSKTISIHFHQMLSPTISPREMYEAYVNADDMKNFFNRKLGKPYQDPSQIPVTLEHLNACAAAGMAAGLVWKKRARNTFMGLDQMGEFNVAIIKERLPDGRQAVIHVEEIYGADPFMRCSELMDEYGVRVCVVEQLPNYNDANRFAKRHLGRVFLCDGYGALAEDVMRWGDGAKVDASDRRTDEEGQSRYTVRLDQYRAMSMSLARLVNTQCLFPDPQALVQEIRQKNARSLKPILKDVVFLHFQKTALVTERIKDGERKLRRRVVEVGIDPHFSYANMLCDIAWSRAHGTATFILPGIDTPASAGGVTSRPETRVALPPQMATLIEEAQAQRPVCGDCAFYPMLPDGPPKHGHCPQLDMKTGAAELACDLFDRASS